MDTISWGNALALQLLLQYDKFNYTIPAMMTPIQNEHDLQCKNEMLVHKLRTPPFWEHETLLNPDKVFFLSMAKDGKIMRHDTLPEKFCKESLKLKTVSKRDLPVYDDKFFKFAFGN